MWDIFQCLCLGRGRQPKAFASKQHDCAFVFYKTNMKTIIIISDKNPLGFVGLFVKVNSTCT